MHIDCGCKISSCIERSYDNRSATVQGAGAATSEQRHINALEQLKIALWNIDNGTATVQGAGTVTTEQRHINALEQLQKALWNTDNRTATVQGAGTAMKHSDTSTCGGCDNEYVSLWV